MEANTGSIAKISATLVGVVYFCIVVWVKKARAVAKIDVIIKAAITFESNKISGVKASCHSSNKKEPTIDRTATVAIWITVNNNDGKLLLYFPVKIICSAKAMAQINISPSPIVSETESVI